MTLEEHHRRWRIFLNLNRLLWRTYGSHRVYFYPIIVGFRNNIFNGVKDEQGIKEAPQDENEKKGY
jgi:hypothetical protein